MRNFFSTFCFIIIAKISFARANLFPSSGNVGIGTTSPRTKLDVIGQVFVTSGAGGTLILEKTTNNYPAIIFKGLSGSSNIEAGDDHLSVYTTGLRRFPVFANGNVSIGTLDSSGYKLAVNGKIRAKEIKVETGWADFVFKPDYKLRSLVETENFIKTNGHLPEIPSEKEVTTNGINLGEMNAKLLQKIEELTLHLIEKDKVLTEVLSRLEKLEDKK